MTLEDNEIFCHKHEVTRIPITPLKSCYDFINQSNNGIIELKLKSFKNILLINSIPEEDPVFEEYILFKETCEQLGYILDFRSIEKSNDFISLINELNPNILIYYGHATYSADKDRGYLIFQDDKLSFESFDNINVMPPLVFLIGCETASTDAFSGGLANHLFSSGTEAVLATLFPIPANHAASFVGRMLGSISDAIKTRQKYSLAGAVFNARKLGWLMDNLETLYIHEVIDLAFYAHLLKEISETVRDLSIKGKRSLTPAEATLIFEDIIQKNGFLEEWNAIKSKTVPYSLFFTLLGRGHDIYFSE